MMSPSALLGALTLLTAHAGAALVPSRLPTAALRLTPARRAPVPSICAASSPRLDALHSEAQPIARVVGGGRRRARLGTLAAALLLAPSLALASSSATEHLHLGQKIALYFQGFGLPDWAVLMLISATPAVELRGGVPVGNWMGLSPAITFAICVVGKMLPIAPVLLGLRSPAVKKLAKPLLDRAEKKLEALPKGQARTRALALFVGVPAPGTGAWTGAIIAYLLDMDFKIAMGAILTGVLLAGGIMTVLTLAGRAGALIALGALCVFGASSILAAKD